MRRRDDRTWLKSRNARKKRRWCVSADGCPARPGGRAFLPRVPDLQRCEHFLLHEARLLDDGKFDDWLGLFTPDAWYWVPSEPDQADPFETVSLIYDDRRLLETRVRRLASPRMYSQEPRSRTSRLIGNVTIESDRRERRHRALQIRDDRIPPRAAAAVRWHRVASPGADDSRIMIAWKRVDLVNCDAPLDGITVPF